jgi:hypothetical protein
MRTGTAIVARAAFAILYFFSALALAAPQPGWYWNPAESGRGFFIESTTGSTVVGGYLYDADGHALWVISGGANADPYNYSGRLLTDGGGQTLFGTYQSPAPSTDLGAVSIHFADDTHATLTWSGGVVPLERFSFGSGTPDFQPFTGWYWNPSENGSGYSIEVQGSNIFFVGYMYDGAGRPVWYLSAGPMSSSSTYSGDLMQFAGGQTIGGAYHPPGPPTTVGTLGLVFSSMARAQLTFSGTSSAASGARTASDVPVRVIVVDQLLQKTPPYALPASYIGTMSSTDMAHQVVVPSGVTEETFTTRQTNVTGLRWSLLDPPQPIGDEAAPTGTYVLDSRTGQVTVNLTQRIVTTAPGLTSDCTRTGSATYLVATLPSGPLSLGTLTVNGYRSYGFDVNAVITPLLIPATTMVCTITDSTGTHTTDPVPAGPEGGVLKIAERGVVTTTGGIKGGPDSPIVTPVTGGTDSYTYSYSFTESR